MIPNTGGVALLENFTIHTFSERVGDVFRVHMNGSGSTELELVSATGIGGGDAPGGRREPFSLVFRGSKDAALQQRTYVVEHDEIGAFELFLVPLGPDAGGMRYEAIFT